MTFALSQSEVSGWNKPIVLVTLILSCVFLTLIRRWFGRSSRIFVLLGFAWAERKVCLSHLRASWHRLTIVSRLKIQSWYVIYHALEEDLTVSSMLAYVSMEGEASWFWTCIPVLRADSHWPLPSSHPLLGFGVLDFFSTVGGHQWCILLPWSHKRSYSWLHWTLDYI